MFLLVYTVCYNFVRFGLFYRGLRLADVQFVFCRFHWAFFSFRGFNIVLFYRCDAFLLVFIF